MAVPLLAARRWMLALVVVVQVVLAVAVAGL
jgi:hypothetical protein